MTSKTYQVFLAAIVVLALTGCVAAPTYQRLQVRDVVVMPEARISKSFYSSDRTDVDVEFGVARAKGSQSFELEPSRARLGDTIFPGPQNVTADFDFKTYDVSVGWRQFLEGRPFGYALTGGIGYVDLDLALHSPTVQAAESISSAAFRMRAAGMWRLWRSTRVEAGATVMAAKSVLDHLAGLDLSLVQTLGPHFVLRGGYTNWQIDSPSQTRSEINLQFSGPSIGLGLKF